MEIPTIGYEAFAAIFGVQSTPRDRLPYMEPGDLNALVALARFVGAESFVEIGVQEGHTAQVLLDEVDSIAEYIGVDVLPGYEPSLPWQAEEIPEKAGHLIADDERVRLLVSPRGSYDLTEENFPHGVDMVFVDGDHSTGMVLHDSHLAYKITRQGGVIVWHDCCSGFAETDEALRQLNEQRPHTLCHIHNTRLCFSFVH